MRLRRLAIAVLPLLLATMPCQRPARAALTAHDLRAAGFHLTPGALLPKAAVLHGPVGDTTLGAALAGKPALVTFTDYLCQSLCGVVLDELADTVPNVPLALGRDYNVISIALDPRQTQSEATAFRDRHAKGSSLGTKGLFVTVDAAALQQIEASVGLVAPFDAEHHQFAHPAGLVLVDADGRAQRVLSPFALNPFDLKLALTETGAAPASFVGHALLNPVSGIYTLQIQRVLSMAAATTVLLIGSAVAFLLWRERVGRRRRALNT